ncbi:S8 family serine peptidase [Rhodocaloribacter sp.]
MYGQTVTTATDAEGNPVRLVVPKGVMAAQWRHGDRVVAEYTLDMNEVVGVIVQFERPPLSLAAEAGKASARAALAAEHDRFRADVAALEAGGAAKTGGALAPAHTVFRFDYLTALNGVALTTRRWVVERIRRLPYVRHVHPDVAVRATDAPSNALIGADRVHADLGVTGRGVVIAVIDTGVNYEHPDLGGGFGPGFKVIGGYDFVHDDDDPMDDHWHGTHVAGIAAGDGETVKGVAPGARIMAFKVLDENGGGQISTVIAAVERAMDPDGDPGTDDAVDVINLSLGGPGNPDDAASQALDNAVAAGIVCAVAAGNSGDYQTINSPGTARRALTVGASDETDHVAAFSSRGPNAVTLGIKPEVTAPGVQVEAPWIGGGYTRRSGTSMATPQVAGAAALLLEAHPEWTPDDVREALMNTAVPLGENVWAEGAGRIDVRAAVERFAGVRAPLLHFGTVDASVPVWTRADTLWVRNPGAEARAVSVAVEMTNAPGVSVSVSPGFATVEAGAERPFVVTVEVDNAATGFSGLPPPLTGRLLFTSFGEGIRVPFAVIKAHQLQLSFDEAPLLLAVLGSGSASFLSPGPEDAFLLPEGTYDLMALYQDFGDASGAPARRTVVVREGVSVFGATPVHLSTAEAVHTLVFRPLGNAGQPLTPTFDYEVWDRDDGFSLLLVTDPLYDEMRTTPLSEAYEYERVVYAYGDPSGDYVIPFRFKGVSASQTLENDPAAFRRIDYTYAVDEGTTELAFIDVQAQATGGELSFFDPNSLHQKLAPPFERTVFLAPKPSETFAFPAVFQEIYDLTTTKAPERRTKANLTYTTATLETTETGVNVYRRFGGAPDAQWTASAIPQKIGSGPPFWSGEMLEFVQDRIYFARPPFFYHPGFESRSMRASYQLFFGDELPLVVAEGSVVNNRFNAVGKTLHFTPGPHVMVWTFEGYRVDGLPGIATARLIFDSNLQFREPSNLQRLEITSNGEVRDVLDPGADNRIVFAAQFDDVTAEVAHRRVGAPAWQALPVTTLAPGLFEAVLPATMDAGYHELRLVLEAPEGGRLEYVADPAFRWGAKNAAANATPTPPRLAEPADGAEIDPVVLGPALRFVWAAAADPDPEDVLRYTFSLAGPGLDTTRTVRTDTTLVLDLRDRLLPGATYTWSVRVSDGVASVENERAFVFHTAALVTATETGGDLPATYELRQNYPNPFNPVTTVPFALPEAATVELTVFDVMGRRVATLVSGRLPAGEHTAVWDAGPYASGVYVYRLRAGSFTETRRMVVMK